MPDKVPVASFTRNGEFFWWYADGRCFQQASQTDASGLTRRADVDFGTEACAAMWPVERQQYFRSLEGDSHAGY